MKKILVIPIFCMLLLATANAQTKLVVAADGSGKYTRIQDAVDAIPAGNTKPVTIYIKNGVYREVLVVDARKPFITIEGQSRDSVVVVYNNRAGTRMPNGDTLNTWTCATVFVYADDFTAKNLTFSNDAGFTAGQAVALRVEGNRAAFFQCRMTGNQDVLFLSGNGVKHYFRDCYIEGTTDFIFGGATAVFEKCHIHSRKNSHVTAASTNSIIPFGFVFFDCELTADNATNKVSLGRPWSPTASVTYIRCRMDKHIVPEGWNNWRNPANEATARYAEYQSTGAGAQPDKRVKWAKQLTEKELEKFSLENILGSWKPYL